MKKLVINNLSYYHCGPISFELNAGECISVSGASGSGKSLLLRAVADLDEHQGEIFLDDMAVGDVPAPEWRKKVALLPAESQWWFDTLGEHFSEIDHELLGCFGFPENMCKRQDTLHTLDVRFLIDPFFQTQQSSSQTRWWNR